MKIKKIKYVIISMFILNLIMMPFAFAISSDIGVDPNDDILESNPSNIHALEYWLGNFYFSESNAPFATDLFNVHSELFNIVDGPNSVDIEKWGIDNNDLYIVVEDIEDYIDRKYFSIGILVMYNNTKDFIIWAGEINIYNGIIEDNVYIAIINEGEVDEANETGRVRIDKTSNTYTLEFDDSWITETEVEVIADDLYGTIFGVCTNGSFFGNVTQYNLDMFPNSYYGQSDDTVETDSTLELTDTILFAIVVLAFLILIFIIVAYYNKSKKGRGNKRTGRKY